MKCLKQVSRNERNRPPMRTCRGKHLFVKQMRKEVLCQILGIFDVVGSLACIGVEWKPVDPAQSLECRMGLGRIASSRRQHQAPLRGLEVDSGTIPWRSVIVVCVRQCDLPFETSEIGRGDADNRFRQRSSQRSRADQAPCRWKARAVVDLRKKDRRSAQEPVTLAGNICIHS